MNAADRRAGKTLSSTAGAWAQAVELLRALLGRREHGAERASAPSRASEMDPRDASVRGMLWSVPLAAVTIFSVYLFSQDQRFDPVLRLLGPFSGVLLVPFLVHATELVTNVRFWDLSDRWDELAGWQRGVLGVIVVVLASVVILSVAFFVAVHLGTSPGGE